VIHDVAVAIKSLHKKGKLRRAMTVDCDVHHGNGTAAIFPPKTDKPHPMSVSEVGQTLRGATAQLRDSSAAEPEAFRKFQPDLICYLAGADPYREDQLGGLALTVDGLQKRDELVLRFARDSSIPVMITLAGGYARHVEDTVRIHCNTVIADRTVFGGALGR
jgi:acetoin utilization deacetylase AcuC-like enzyme